MHFIHLNINSLLSKIDETSYIAKLANTTVTGLNETKLDNTVLNCELDIEEYDLVRSDQPQRGGRVAYFPKNTILYNRKPNYCNNTESMFIEILLTKSKPVLIDILYRPPDRNDFVNFQERTFSNTNFIEPHECYFLMTSM